MARQWRPHFLNDWADFSEWVDAPRIWK